MPEVLAIVIIQALAFFNVHMHCSYNEVKDKRIKALYWLFCPVFALGVFMAAGCKSAWRWWIVALFTQGFFYWSVLS